jgi:hypothetical protein
VSQQHLQAYLSEYTFRFNRRFYPMTAFNSLLGLGVKTIPDTFTRIDPTKLAAKWRAGLTAYATDPVAQQFMRAGLASRATCAACAWDGCYPAVTSASAARYARQANAADIAEARKLLNTVLERTRS